jgi:hypothetical protein
LIRLGPFITTNANELTMFANQPLRNGHPTLHIAITLNAPLDAVGKIKFYNVIQVRSRFRDYVNVIQGRSSFRDYVNVIQVRSRFRDYVNVIEVRSRFRDYVNIIM